MSIVELLVEPVTQYAFMRIALAAAVVVGATSAVLSCLLVVRGQALLGDAISHAVLLGVVLGYLVGGELGVPWGAMVVAVATGALISYVTAHAPIRSDTSMGILFTATFALGLAIISVAQPRGIDLFHVLFGNVLGVTRTDLVVTSVAGGLVVAVVLIGFRGFQLWSFDAELARAMGMRTQLMEYVFVALLSAAVVASLQTVGVILVVAMLITPGATGAMLATRLSTMMLVAVGVGLTSSVVGLYSSYHLNVASGPAIVLTASACFAVAFVAAPRRGVVARAVVARTGRLHALDEDLHKALLDDTGRPAPRTVTELGRELGASAGVVGRRVRRGARRGALRLDAGDTVTLTDVGASEALRLVRTHRLLEQYLHVGERVPVPDLHRLADDLEHTTDPRSVDDLDRLLGLPSRDPHGHPIPSDRGELPASDAVALATLAPDETAVVVMVDDDDPELLRELLRRGLVPDVRVRVVQADDHGLRVQTGTTEHELTPALTDAVWVRRA